MNAHRRIACGVVGLGAALLIAHGASPGGPGQSRKNLPANDALAQGGWIALTSPSLDGWTPERRARRGAGDFDAALVVTDFEISLHDEPGGDVVGLARIGARLPAEPTERDCDGGRWYRVSGAAYACSDGARVIDGDEEATLSAAVAARRPSVDRPTPHSYVKVTGDFSPRFNRRPTRRELSRALERRYNRSSMGGLVERWMNGTYLVAMADSVEVGGTELLRTVGGHYILADEVEPKPVVEMRGERLEGERRLPIAFAVRETELHCRSGEASRLCGHMERHARFSGARRVRWGGAPWVRGPGGIAAPAGAVRIAAAIERPKHIPATSKWIHIHLDEQALVAYEGDTPVYATLISTGKRSHATPPGLFRVERKYVTKTMRGRDESGLYEVQEVPWTMYYHGTFAVHGAYWHDGFGNTRSHGCVNVPPADARWLYVWSDDRLPAGWHARLDLEGTYVYVTGKTPPDPEPRG